MPSVALPNLALNNNCNANSEMDGDGKPSRMKEGMHTGNSDVTCSLPNLALNNNCNANSEMDVDGKPSRMKEGRLTGNSDVTQPGVAWKGKDITATLLKMKEWRHTSDVMSSFPKEALSSNSYGKSNGRTYSGPRDAASEPLLNAERNTDKRGRDATPVNGKTQPRTYNPVEGAASGPAGEARSLSEGHTHCCSLGSKGLVGIQWSKVHQRPLQKLVLSVQIWRLTDCETLEQTPLQMVPQSHLIKKNRLTNKMKSDPKIYQILSFQFPLLVFGHAKFHGWTD